MASSFPLVQAVASGGAPNGYSIITRAGDIQRFLGLVTSEHSDKPNFMAWLTQVLSRVDDSAGGASGFNNAFDLDNAYGLQLDIIGQVVGVSRTVNFQPSNGISPVLDDGTYRLALRARIAKNQWDGTITGIQTIWSNLFPVIYLVLYDNQDMTMNALVTGLTSSIQKDLVTNGYIVPRPTGVLINYAYPAHKLFSFGIENSVFGGYGDSYWNTF